MKKLICSLWCHIQHTSLQTACLLVCLACNTRWVHQINSYHSFLSFVYYFWYIVQKLKNVLVRVPALAILKYHDVPPLWVATCGQFSTTCMLTIKQENILKCDNFDNFVKIMTLFQYAVEFKSHFKASFSSGISHHLQPFVSSIST